MPKNIVNRRSALFLTQASFYRIFMMTKVMKLTANNRDDPIFFSSCLQLIGKGRLSVYAPECRGAMGVKRGVTTSPQSRGAQTSDPVLEVKTSITHHFCSDRFQCLSRLQGGGYVALGGISFGLKRRWQPRLVEAPLPRALRQGRPEAAGNGRESCPGIPDGGNFWDSLPAAAVGPRPPETLRL